MQTKDKIEPQHIHHNAWSRLWFPWTYSTGTSSGISHDNRDVGL